MNEITLDLLSKKNIDFEIKQIHNIKDKIISNDKEFLDIFYSYALNESKELDFKDLKKVLNDLSINYGFDLEPSNEFITLKHVDMTAISFPIFKENLFEWLQKQEKLISTMIFMENNELKATEKQNNIPEYTSKVNVYTFNAEDDYNSIVLYRSLYLLKRKFEIYEKEISYIYSKYKESDKVNLVIDIKNFIPITNMIFKECYFSFAEMIKPNDVFKIELLNEINEEKMKLIFDLFNKFMINNRDKYNAIIKEKKIKGYVKLNQIEDSQWLDKRNNQELTDFIEKIVKEENVNSPNLINAEDNNLIDDNVDKIEEYEENPEENNVDIVPNEIKENEIIKEDNEIPQPINVEENTTVNKHETLKNLEQDLNNDINSYIGPENPEIIPDTYTKLKMQMESMDKQNEKSKDIKKDFLLIESLPLIIADFIHENDNVILVNFNDELRNELRSLFDNEILNRLGESIKIDINQEKEMKLKDLLFEKLNIEKNIKVYEDLLIQKLSKRENIFYIEKMFQKLKDQKKNLELRIKSLQEDETVNNYSLLLENEKSKIINKTIIHPLTKKKPTKEELRHNALKEIFYFYSRQHKNIGKKGTFDQIRDKHEHMNLSEFMKFCVEFKIMLNKQLLIELFKKTAENTKEMSFEQFNIILTTICNKLNESKIKMLNKRSSKLKNDLKELNKAKDKKDKVIQKKDEIESDEIDYNENKNELLNYEGNEDKPDEKNENNEIKPFSNESLIDIERKTPNALNIIELELELKKINLTITQLKNKSLELLIEELYSYLDIDNENVYRTKMKGFLLPFGTRNKEYRIPQEVLMKKVKKLDPRTAHEIQRILSERKEERKKKKEEEERIEKLKIYEQRKILNKLTIKPQDTKKAENKYSSIVQKHNNFEKEKDSKVTWDQLENLDFNHFITNREDDFDPGTFIYIDNYDYSDDDDLFSHLKDSNIKNQNNDKNIYNYNNAAIINSDTDDRSHEETKVFTNKLENSVAKTENKAREVEKGRIEKAVKLINKYEDMQKKGLDKVKKYK